MSKDKPRRVTQELAAVDNFSELPGRKRGAEQTARNLGHQMGPWHKRANDPYGRQNSFCLDCNAPMVVCVEVPPLGSGAFVYGPALRRRCGEDDGHAAAEQAQGVQ